MVEPRDRPVRPTTMRAPRASLPLLLVGLVVLVGCGSTTPDPGPGSSASPGATSGATSSPTSSPASGPRASPADRVGECRAEDDPVRDAARMTTADLDGDGSPDDVRVTAPGARGCPGILFAEVADGFLVAPTPEGPAVTSGSAARLPGTGSDVLVTEQRHPRGGTRTRLWMAADGALAELQDPDGNPVVPFVATDTPPAPVSVTCTDGGLVVTEAVAHEPAGVIFTWDVRRTTYAVTEGRAERTDRAEIADNVLPGQLQERFPELARGQVLSDCRL